MAAGRVKHAQLANALQDRRRCSAVLFEKERRAWHLRPYLLAADATRCAAVVCCCGSAVVRTLVIRPAGPTRTTLLPFSSVFTRTMPAHERSRAQGSVGVPACLRAGVLQPRCLCLPGIHTLAGLGSGTGTCFGGTKPGGRPGPGWKGPGWKGPGW